MKTLKVPSLQHLARNWSDRPEKIEKRLVNLALNPPNFSYEPLFSIVRDFLVFDLPLDDVIKGVQTRVKQESVRKNFVELLPLVHQYFQHTKPSFVAEVGGRQYSVARDLQVPFTPQLIYGVNGETYFPWFSFWRSNPMSGENLSLFVTLVSEILSQDADFDGSNFKILDFSVPKGGGSRSIEVIDTREIVRVSEARKREMLEIFIDGFRRANVTLLELSKGKSSNVSTGFFKDDRSGVLFTE